MFCFLTAGRETQRKSGYKSSGENQPDRRDGHFQHVCSAAASSHSVSNILICQPDGAGVIRAQDRSAVGRSLGTGISLVKERSSFGWSESSSNADFRCSCSPPSQPKDGDGKRRGNSEFPLETSFASWQICEVAVTFQERKLFRYIPSCFNFPLLISGLVSVIKPHFR